MASPTTTASCAPRRRTTRAAHPGNGRDAERFADSDGSDSVTEPRQLASPPMASSTTTAQTGRWSLAPCTCRTTPALAGRAGDRSPHEDVIPGENGDGRIQSCREPAIAVPHQERADPIAVEVTRDHHRTVEPCRIGEDRGHLVSGARHPRTGTASPGARRRPVSAGRAADSSATVAVRCWCRSRLLCGRNSFQLRSIGQRERTAGPKYL